MKDEKHQREATHHIQDGAGHDERDDGDEDDVSDDDVDADHLRRVVEKLEEAVLGRLQVVVLEVRVDDL